MFKGTSYQEKFILIKPWLDSIIEKVKKDLKNEHLVKDKRFCSKYFLGKNPNQIKVSEMIEAYAKDIAEGNVGLGEFIASRWLLKNTDLYGFFEDKLKVINPDFDQINEISLEQSFKMIEESIKEYDPGTVYIFCVFNEVAFHKEAAERLKTIAEKRHQALQEESEEKETVQSLDSLKKRHAREISTLSDRFEKKFIGLQKKYLNDVEALKKQISTLQRKITDGLVQK